MLSTKVDPISLELVNNYLQSVADEMAYTLGRTCASPLIRDAQDFSAGFCDAQGNTLAVSIVSPHEIMVPSVVTKYVLEKFKGRLYPGDVIVVNDPYHGGTHLPDWRLMKPVFANDALLGVVFSKAHQVDVGGKVPGSMNFDNDEIFQEGLRMSPLKLYERGEPNETLMDIIRLNVRYPDVLFADVGAMLLGLEVGERAALELVNEYDVEVLQSIFAAALDHAERLARAQIRDWPEGSYSFVDHCDDDGVTGNPVVIKVKITVSGGEVYGDFTGTSAQVPAAINFPPYEAVSRFCEVVRCCLDGELPHNNGLFRPVHVYIPEGTICNPRPPAPCAERGLVSYRIADAVLGAFSQFVPHKVIAACEGGSYVIRLGGRDSVGKQFLFMDLVHGAWGARQARDGVDGMSDPQTNHTNVPVEIIEAHYPLRVERYGLVPDSGGAGKFRGGHAVIREYRFLGESEGIVRTRTDRRKFRPYGLYGGDLGSPSSLTLNPDGDHPADLPARGAAPIQKEDVVQVVIASGGGWGDRLERDPQQVLEDYLEGLESIEHAKSTYGVIVDEAAAVVDTAATDALRARLRSKATGTRNAVRRRRAPKGTLER